MGAEKYLTTHHERDTETGLDYRGARYYDADIARFLSLDPKAANFAAWSPYNYVLGNPLSFVDPDGREVVNAYEKYKGYAGLEEKLKENRNNASNRKERQSARKELRKNRDNIQGYKNYQKVGSLLNEFKTKNEGEFNRIDNLELNHIKVDVVVGLKSGFTGNEMNQNGETKYDYDPNYVFDYTNTETGEHYDEPSSILGNKIEISLFYNGRNLGTLSNEFGDAIFGVENVRASFSDRKAKTKYWDRASTKFSFDYNEYIMKDKPKPNPQDY